MATEYERIQRAVERDPRAFGELYELYCDRIYAYLYFKTMQRQVAEDLTAAVFLKAWEAIGNFKWQGYPFSAWLFRIAHNQLIDHYRTTPRLVPLRGEMWQAAEEPWEFTERQMLCAQVHKALRDLTCEQEQVVRLRYLEGYSIGEIARMLGKSADAIRAVQHRALRGLQPRLVALTT
jgi:RNA polymerase sigma-70 factor (ECF subfamily)